MFGCVGGESVRMRGEVGCMRSLVGEDCGEGKTEEGVVRGWYIQVQQSFDGMEIEGLLFVLLIASYEDDYTFPS